MVVKTKKSTQKPDEVITDRFVKEVSLCRDNVVYCSGLSPQKEIKFNFPVSWFPRNLTVSVDTKTHQLDVLSVDELDLTSSELLNIAEEFKRGLFNKFVFQVEIIVEDSKTILSLADCVDKIFDEFLVDVALNGVDVQRIFNLGIVESSDLYHLLSPGICSLGLIGASDTLSAELLLLLIASYSLDASKTSQETNDFIYNVLKKQKDSLKELIVESFDFSYFFDGPFNRNFCLNSKHQDDDGYLESLKAIIVLMVNYLPSLLKKQLISCSNLSSDNFNKVLKLFKETTTRTLPTSTEDKLDLFFDWIYYYCYEVIDSYEYADDSDFNKNVMDGEKDYFFKERLSIEQFILFEKIVGVDLVEIFSEKDNREHLLSFFKNSLGVDSFGIFIPNTGSRLDNLLKKFEEINRHHTKLNYKIISRIASYCANKIFVEEFELPSELVVDENRNNGGAVSELMGTYLTYCSIDKEMFLDKLIVRFHAPDFNPSKEEEVKTFKKELIKQLMDLNKNLIVEFQYKPLTERRRVESSNFYYHARTRFKNTFCVKDLKDFYSSDQLERISLKPLEDTEYFDNYSGIKNARDVILVPVSQ